MTLRVSLVVLVACAAFAAAPFSSPSALSVVNLLDRYAAGRFDEVVAELSAEGVDYKDLLGQFREHGPAWIAAAGPERQPRRQIVAATVALEAARAGAWVEWKRVQKQPLMCAVPSETSKGAECYQPPPVLYWEAPPQLLEWGCALLRQRITPAAVERWWHLGALGVANLSEDLQVLVGDPLVGRGFEFGEIVNRNDEIGHLGHARERFPDEMRFVLAEGIARERAWPEEAVAAYTSLKDDPDVGGEATMRLGALQARQRDRDALGTLERVERLTRDPYVIYLARYFSAQVHERERRLDRAEAAYRGAAAAVPYAQSATIALAALVFRDGRRAEAQALIADMLAATPVPRDPWREYVHADARFWPQVIVELRQEIAR